MELIHNKEKIDEFYAKWKRLGWNCTGAVWEGHVDPERLIIETTHAGRYDDRLYEAMMTWIRNFGDLINVQRILHFIDEADRPVLGAAVDIAIANGANGKRLQTIIKHCRRNKTREVLFKGVDDFGNYERNQKEFARKEYLKWGFYCSVVEFYDDAMFTRKYVLEKNPLLALRAFFGPSVRAEILFHLEKKARMHIRGLAEKIGYAYSAVYNEVMTMVENGLLSSEDYGRAKVISMSEPLSKYLLKMPV